MNKITTGSWIKRIRTEQRVSKATLSEGLCVYQRLQKIEEDRAECSLELFTILLQRLGKSPDKLEYILPWREYRIQCIRDWFMICVFKGNRRWAERALWLYQEKLEEAGSVQQMHLCRGRAMLAYWLAHDMAEAEGCLEETLDTTFCCWKEADWTGCRVSVLELENALALVRVYREQGKDDDGLLARCGEYIEKFVTDGEEHAKIYSKYAWLAAGECLREGCPERALSLCEEGVRELQQYNIEYFIEPLLKTMLMCYEQMGCEVNCSGMEGGGTEECEAEADGGTEECGNKTNDDMAEERLTQGRCQSYLRVLMHMREQTKETWYPEDCILWNCCNKMYHLDYEIFGAERRAQGMTQDRAVAGVYQNAKELGKIERERKAPSRKNFLLLMRKFGLDRERRTSLVFSDSFEVIELRRQMQGCSSRRRYDELGVMLGELERQLDMKVMENWRTVRFYQNTIDMMQENRPYEELMAEDIDMLRRTYAISLEEIIKQPTMTAPRKSGRGRPKKGPGQKEQIYRTPLKNEADLLNQIAILLKRMGRSEEAVQLYEGVLCTFERSRVRPEYRFNSYELLLGNMAGDKESIEDAEKGLRLCLRCGKLENLAENYMAMACAMLDDSANRELCRQMMQDSYYLLDLSKNTHDKNIVREYYKDVFGEEIEEN